MKKKSQKNEYKRPTWVFGQLTCLICRCHVIVVGRMWRQRHLARPRCGVLGSLFYVVFITRSQRSWKKTNRHSSRLKQASICCLLCINRLNVSAGNNIICTKQFNCSRRHWGHPMIPSTSEVTLKAMGYMDLYVIKTQQSAKYVRA